MNTNTEVQLIPLNDHGLISVEGPDALTFLQGQLTADIREITELEHRLAAHCNTKGRITTLYRVFKPHSGSGFYLQLPKSMLEKSLENLKKYARFSKVSVSDNTSNFAQIAVLAASPSPAFFQKLIQEALSEESSFQELNILTFQNFYLPDNEYCPVHFNPQSLNKTQNQNVSISKNDSAVLLTPYQIIGPKETVEKFLAKNYPTAKKHFPSAWILFEIRNGIPNIYPGTSETILPHHINLPTLNGVSFKKGCYLGQEIIARMEHLGQVKKHMVQARILKNPNNFIANSTPPKKSEEAHHLREFELRSYDSVTEKLPLPGTEIFSELNESSPAIGKIISIAPSNLPDILAECLVEIQKTNQSTQIFTKENHLLELIIQAACAEIKSHLESRENLSPP